jgi:tetratricopeptide (TPR) repeat protein
VKTPQVILILVAIAISAALYLMPIAPIAEAANAEAAPVEAYDILADITEIKNGLDSGALANIARWETASTTENTDSIIAYYDLIRKPIGSSYYAQKRAEKSNTSEHWAEAGQRFFLNAKYMGSPVQKTVWFAEARTCFEKALELDPENLEVKVDLGVCLIEGSSFLGTPPMEGIGILKSVEQKDPTNIKVLINLGYFAIKSGQYDKAEERFNQVIEIDPKYAEAYLYLADLHEKQKKYPEAISDLEKFKSLLEDPTKAVEVDEYILELSKNI